MKQSVCVKSRIIKVEWEDVNGLKAGCVNDGSVAIFGVNIMNKGGLFVGTKGRYNGNPIQIHR